MERNNSSDFRPAPLYANVLKFAVCGALGIGAILLSSASWAQSAGDPIKIGLVYAKQGSFALFGSTQAQGAQFAAEEKGMKVLGREIKVIWYDEADPNDAQQNMMKLIQQDKVSGVIGGSNSATALAMSAVAKREKMPLVLGAGSAKDITGAKCNRYTFRSSYSLAVANRAMGTYILSQGKKWYFLTANYAFGQDTYAQLKPYLIENGGTEVARDEIPLGTSDYSSFILKIRQANPDVVVAALGGADYTNFLKQFSEYGLASKIKVANPFASDDYIWGLSPEAAVGIYTKVWHYDNPANSAEEKAFAQAWMKKYSKPASVEAWEGWISMRMLLAAIEKAKATDNRSIVTALENTKVDAYSYRSWDHQMLKQVPIISAHAPAGGDKWNMMDLVANLPQSGSAKDLEALFGDQKEVGCNMDDF